jgi:hypothetical protein
MKIRLEFSRTELSRLFRTVWPEKYSSKLHLDRINAGGVIGRCVLMNHFQGIVFIAEFPAENGLKQSHNKRIDGCRIKK